MKIILLFLISISSFAKTIVIPLNHSYLIDGQKEKINGVYDTIKCVGQRGPTGFINVHGTPGKPIVIIGLNVKASVLVGNAVSFDNCSYFRFTGANLEGGNMCLEFRYLTTNFEVDHVKIINAGYGGIIAKTDPKGPETLWGAFTLKDVYIHDCIISTLSGEGMYIGNSHMNNPNKKEHAVTGVRVENNIIESSGADGIQIYSTNAKVSGNTIRNFGKSAGSEQNSGIQIQPGFIGEVSDNWIDTGMGFGIFAGGSGNSILRNNTLLNCGSGILVQTYTPFQPKAWDIKNNVIIDCGNEGIYSFSVYPTTATDNVIIRSTIPIRLNNGTKFTEVGTKIYK